ncbi:hypothetical protein GCM10008018_65150 [Paenibacillus marchantiophytorum]|uniref:Uncharacterized protein n=1 Tax=Paenibacillus marchantiophytorum TaxID=1619310 RepID=A0ABQ1FG12_9BACL|nr:hypothetical protein GCM10008018_65150 [Paenibacillus marchantiophytorum]
MAAKDFIPDFNGFNAIYFEKKKSINVLNHFLCKRGTIDFNGFVFY